MINRLSNPINRNRSAAKISKVMSSTRQTEGAPARGFGTDGCADSLTCGGVGLGGLGSAKLSPWYHFDETGDLKPEYIYWRLNNG